MEGLHAGEYPVAALQLGRKQDRQRPPCPGRAEHAPAVRRDQKEVRGLVLALVWLAVEYGIKSNADNARKNHPEDKDEIGICLNEYSTYQHILLMLLIRPKDNHYYLICNG
ncbi:MAG: hypothetical protein ACI4C3_01870 [Bacteroides sp.]